MSDVDAWLESVRAVSTQNVFNPYRSTCAEHDQENAAHVRFGLLSALVRAAVRSGTQSMWIGRDLGYRGGRRTGLALTDDVHIREHLARWDLVAPQPYLKSVVAERTASVVWRELSEIDENIFLWNVFPYHPHSEQTPMSNRAHTSKERAIGEELLAWLVRLLKPRQLVAIGNDAYTSASRCVSGAPVYRVRHPSYGGQADFVRGIRGIFCTGRP